MARSRAGLQALLPLRALVKVLPVILPEWEWRRTLLALELSYRH